MGPPYSKLHIKQPQVKSLSYRVVKWDMQTQSLVTDTLQSSSDEDQYAAVLNAKGLIEIGIDIIRATKTVETTYNNLCNFQPETNSPPPLQFTSLKPVLDIYCLIRIARLFYNPLWRFVHKQPPAAQHIPKLSVLTSLALELLQNHLPYIGCESILYLQFLPRLALEVTSTNDRSRLISIMRSVLNKGYLTTASYLSDIEVLWQTTGRPVTEQGKCHLDASLLNDSPDTHQIMNNLYLEYKLELFQ